MRIIKFRGNEVIEILEMLGGKNRYHFKGDEDEWFVLNGNIQRTDRLFAEKGLTLEEFLEKYPYKVGDKVLYKHDNQIFFIRKMFWENDKILYELSDEVYSGGCSIPDTIIFDVDVVKLKPYKKETMEDKGILVQIDLTKELCVADEVEVILGDYEFILKDGKTYFIKKKPQYPKTYEECCKVLNLTKYPPALVPNKATYINQYKDFPCYYEIQKLAELIVCRNAYWKIAGEQMGLGKPWEHDMSKDEFSSAISYQYGHIQKCEIRHQNKILIFPTKEMRDAFYENFKELIELVKELL